MTIGKENSMQIQVYNKENGDIVAWLEIDGTIKYSESLVDNRYDIKIGADLKAVECEEETDEY